MKKLIVMGIIILCVGAGILPSAIGINDKKVIHSENTSRGYIQGLIDNASAGDTIYIPAGIYYENIDIIKSISLIGEDKNTTIIDGGFYKDVIGVYTQKVNISGFTIQNSGGYIGIDSGIRLGSNYCTITDNILKDNSCGIHLFNWSFTGSNENIIMGNTFTNNEKGIYIAHSRNNTIEHNTFISNENSIYIFVSYGNSIIKNNFVNIQQWDYFSCNKSENSYEKNIWSQNYWNRPRLFPKLIHGVVLAPFGFGFALPWFNIDWRPAQEPYDIGGV
jgi:nitrous oxidase accessory protein